jgi:hypothetical protein
MTRRSLAGISVLLISLQAVLSLSRAITLTVERRADIDLFGHDPLLDIGANYAFFVLGAGAAIAMLFWRRRSLWIASILLLVAGLAESAWLVAADFGGLPNLPLLLVRGFALIVLLTDDVRRQFE